MPELFRTLQAELTPRCALQRELGGGGMSPVYLAEGLKHGRQVAIQVLHPDLSAALGRDRFLSAPAPMTKPDVLLSYASHR